MSPQTTSATSVAYVSIGIFAWNEEASIASALHSLFRQSLFQELSKRGLGCEVICVVNGCTDPTPDIARRVFDDQTQRHPDRSFFKCSVVNLSERGKLNAWNQFVHIFSAKEARFLVMMDADILIHRGETLWNMVSTLERNTEASVSVDQPRKDILFKRNRTMSDRLSLAATQMTAASDGQLCAQLYCIRSEVARNIYLPKDLAACEDGFIKHLVCTDFLRHQVKAERICLAPNAEHTFEAYTSPAAIFKNQKRQIIGQTIVHILVDNHLKTIPLHERLRLAATLSEKDNSDPSWLKRLIRDHVQQARFFWRLYPGLLRHRFNALRKLTPLKRLICLPAAAVGFVVTIVSSIMAYSFLKGGATDYWPGKGAGVKPVGAIPAAGLEFTSQNSK